MAKPSPWRDFYDGDIAPRRHSSPFGDTYQPLATSIAIWRHIPDLARGLAKARQPRELDHILHSVSTYAVQEMATAMLSLLFCRALVILVALPRYASPSRNSSRDSATALELCAMQAVAAHLAVPRPSRNRDFGRDSQGRGNDFFLGGGANMLICLVIAKI